MICSFSQLYQSLRKISNVQALRRNTRKGRYSNDLYAVRADVSLARRSTCFSMVGIRQAPCIVLALPAAVKGSIPADVTAKVINDFQKQAVGAGLFQIADP